MTHSNPAEKTKRLFQNSILEKLTRTHIAVPLTIFFLYALALFIGSVRSTGLSLSETTGLFAGGLFIWTLAEYILHRFVFHSGVGSSFQYTVHGVHHEFPGDKSRLAMPPVISGLIATTLLLALLPVAGRMSFGFMAGFIAGYAMYLCVHYVVHVFPAPHSFLRYLWTHHARHHYKHGDKCFGVSSPLWDIVFGTMPQKK